MFIADRVAYYNAKSTIRHMNQETLDHVNENSWEWINETK